MRGRPTCRIGRRRLLLTGAAAFGVASVLAAYSTSPEMLIATRALLGVAGATLMPSTLALISNMFGDPRQRATAIGVWLSCFMGGMVLGPLVGGALLVTFWWGAAFLLGVPVMLVLLVAGPKLLPEYRDPSAGRVDLISVGLSLATVLLVIYGLKELAKHGLQVVPVASLLVGVAFGYVFTRRQRRLSHPLIDLRLLGNRAFSTSLTIMLLTGVVMSGTSLFVALYLQMVQGLTPLAAGLWMTPQAVAMIAGSMLAPRLARRFRPGALIAAGLAISAAGLSLLIVVGLVAAGSLPDEVGTDLLGSAREAFTSGLNVTAAVATVVLLGLAVVAGVALRHLRSHGESAESAGREAPVTGEVDVRVEPSLT